VSEELLPTSVVARRLGVQGATVRLWILRRRLPGVKLGRLWRVPVSAVDRIVAEGAQRNTEEERRSGNVSRTTKPRGGTRGGARNDDEGNGV
jgi:excisionase family DNA binding protein